MRRSSITAASATALAVLAAAPALAATPGTGTFKAGKGQIENGYDLRFEVDRGGRRIKGLVAHVLEQCAGDSTSSTTTVGPKLTWKVDAAGRFSGRKRETSGSLTLYTTLKGRFTSAGTAKGTLRQESIVAGATCDTSELDFTAKRR